MDAQDAITLTQQAMLTALLLGADLLAGVLVGLSSAWPGPDADPGSNGRLRPQNRRHGRRPDPLPALARAKDGRVLEGLITNIPKTITAADRHYECQNRMTNGWKPSRSEDMCNFVALIFVHSTFAIFDATVSPLLTLYLDQFLIFVLVLTRSAAC